MIHNTRADTIDLEMARLMKAGCTLVSIGLEREEITQLHNLAGHAFLFQAILHSKNRFEDSPLSRNIKSHKKRLGPSSTYSAIESYDDKKAYSQ